MSHFTGNLSFPTNVRFNETPRLSTVCDSLVIRVLTRKVTNKDQRKDLSRCYTVIIDLVFLTPEEF